MHHDDAYSSLEEAVYANVPEVSAEVPQHWDREPHLPPVQGGQATQSGNWDGVQASGEND